MNRGHISEPILPLVAAGGVVVGYAPQQAPQPTASPAQNTVEWTILQQQQQIFNQIMLLLSIGMTDERERVVLRGLIETHLHADFDLNQLYFNEHNLVSAILLLSPSSVSRWLTYSRFFSIDGYWRDYLNVLHHHAAKRHGALSAAERSRHGRREQSKSHYFTAF